MTRRRITRALGAAAGGLLGAAFLPVAAAFADDYDIVPDPSSTEEVTGLYGIGLFGVETASPAVGGSVQGTQLFEAEDTTSGTSGTFDADEATVTDVFGDANDEVLVTQDVSGTAPPVGSVFDAYTFGDSGFENIYSDLASTTPGGDTISDTLVTPFGDFTIPVVFDGAAGLASDSFLGGAAGGPLGAAFPLADGDDIVPASAQGVGIDAINGLSPLFKAIQGYQEFDVDGAAGNPVGTFDADVTTTGDILGFTTEEVLVTSDVTGTAGTSAGDVPPVGSVFNTFFYGDSGYDYVYSDIPTPSGDVITTTLVTPYGDITTPDTFAATAADTAFSPVAFGDGDDIVAAPGSTEVLTGVNGLPPADVADQGYQLFDVDNAAGTAIGSFDADETTTTADSSHQVTQTLLVTSDEYGASGTAAGDVPPVGSVIETITFGDSGIENIYTDLASTAAGEDVISDTLVTPFGDLTIPVTMDAAAGLATDLFLTLP
jgi:hypothetical protein